MQPGLDDLISDCVHCGFCLPTCPTYDLWSEEMDSPRGRIVLMKELAGGEISPELVTHVDRCLGCMACVTACPSGVQVRPARQPGPSRDRAALPAPAPRAPQAQGDLRDVPAPPPARSAIPFLPLARFAPFDFARLAPEKPPRITLPEGGRRGRARSASCRAASNARSSPTSTPRPSPCSSPRATRSTPLPSSNAAARSSCTPVRPTRAERRAREVAEVFADVGHHRHQRRRAAAPG